MSTPLPPLQVRDAQPADLPRLAEWLGGGVSLPTVAGERLLLATADDQPLATLRLVPAIGLALPRASYHVGCTVHAAAELGLFHRQRTLLLGHDHTGASELADIAWPADGVPLAALAAALRALLQAVTAQLAAARDTYAARLVVELPGRRDAAGQSPFWQGLGRHFYAGDPAAAAARHGPAWRSHVAALLPRQPLLVSFLPAAAQAAIGQIDERARVLKEVLEDAGLRYGHHVNLEDGGPILEAEVDDLVSRLG